MQPLSPDLERLPMLPRQGRLDRRRLAHRDPLADDRLDRRLVRRIEADRPEVVELRLEPADDLIALADLVPAGPIVVERQGPGDLVTNGVKRDVWRRHLGFAPDHIAVLPHDRSRRPGPAIDRKRHRQPGLVAAEGARRRGETAEEALGGGETKSAAWLDRELDHDGSIAAACGPVGAAPRPPPRACSVQSRPMAIYLDHAATTPLRREALDAMLPFLTESFGNPSSAHGFGRVARAALDEAHERVAARLHAEPREIIFTSGGTEANNLAIKGAAWAGKGRGHRIVTSTVEHHAVGHTLKYLERFGFEVFEVPVDRYGRIDPDELDAAITDKTILVTIMLANNEVGTVQRIAEIARRVRTHKGVLLSVDAVQGAPYIDLDVEVLGIDMLSIGAHKFEGPKGVGVLYLRHGTHILSQQQGGTQERHRRAGTENVAGAVGLAAAYDLACDERPDTVRKLRRQRDRLKAAVLAVDGAELTGHPKERLPGLLSIIARDTDGASVALSLDLEGIACSVGSACTAGSTEVSHVLSAMGYPDEEARGALRMSLGRTTTDAEIETSCDIVPRVIASMRLGSAAVAADPLGQGVTV